MSGRSHLDIEDIAAVAPPVLRHRILLRLESELDGLDPDQLVHRIITAWRGTA
jgi:MoxR-like ATPase